MLSWGVDIGAAAALVVAFWLRPMIDLTEPRIVLAGVCSAAGVAVAVVLRWRLPAIAPAVALVATGIGWVLEASTDPLLGVAWSLYPLAVRSAVRARLLGVAAVVTLIAVSVSYGGEPSGGFDQRIVLAGAAIGIAWLLGHTEARRQEATREAVRQEAEAEQARRQNAMAREVHDVVGHALSVISAEADVARSLPDLREADLRSSLADIEHRARSALEEVQGLVRALRTGESSTQAAVILPQLVAAARASGLEVAQHIEVTAASHQTDLVVVRVVQEAVSNVIRHAGARWCEVSVSPEDGAVVVRIDDDGSGLPDDWRPGTGLIGMRERVEGLGGSLTVTNRLAGGTRVLARVPVAAVS